MIEIGGGITIGGGIIIGDVPVEIMYLVSETNDQFITEDGLDFVEG